MSKRAPKALLTIVFIVFIAATIGIILSDLLDSTSPGGYEVSSITKRVKVYEDNTYFVIDSMSINYTRKNAKMIYQIPLESDELDVRISDINVDSTGDMVKFSLDKDRSENINVVIESKGYTGSDTLTINYKVDKGEDYDETKDSFDFELFNTDIISEVSTLKFDLEFPKEIDTSKLSFLLGSANTKDFTYSVNNGIILGEYTSENNIPLTQDASVHLELNEGYFLNERNSKSVNWLMTFVYAIFAIVFGLLWFFKGKDDKIIPTPSFYPPEGFNPLEVGYWIDGSVEYSDIFYMIIYWANEGYIKIEKLSVADDIDGKKNYIFTKLRELDINKPEYEKMLFKAFFELGDEEATKNEFHTKVFRTETDALYGTLQYYADNVYEAEQAFIKQVNNNEAEGYDKSAEQLFAFMKLVSTFIWVFAIYFYSLPNAITIIDFLPMIVVMLIVGISLFLAKDTFYTFIAYTSPILILTAITKVDLKVLVLAMLPVFFTAYVRKRTFKYNEILGKIYGFRSLISNNKYKSQINEIAKADPGYFYKILPYAFVLYKGKHWKEQFDQIYSPAWYVSRDGEGLNSQNIEEFIKQMQTLCDEILNTVNMSAVADKKKTSREGLDYVTKTERMKNAGLSPSDMDDDI